MTNCQIIKAEAEDFSAIAELNYLAYREMAARVPTWTSEEFFHTLVATRAQSATFFVLRKGNKIIGSVAYAMPGRSVDPIPTSWASMLLLAVRHEYRRHGHGRLLANTCITLARKDRAETIGLFTSELMTSAHRLYEGLGFHIETELAPRHGLRYWLYRYDLLDSVKIAERCNDEPLPAKGMLR
jgi:ribosomal protein S18 acetylase RimI-like enzyme